MQNNFWKNKNVLITGSGGFVGSHLSRYAKKKGARVIGIINRSQVDISSYSKLSDYFKNYHIDVCYHLAANPLVEAGQKDPYSSLKNNFLTTLNVLELCRIYSVKKIIITSTVHVYGEGNSLFHEEDPPRPSRPYETSKTCADLIAQSYADTFRLPVLIPRFVNIYGPGDINFTRVIPKTIQSVLENKNPVLWGGESIREYLYIDDVLSAFDVLAQMGNKQIERNRIYNFGTGEPISVRELLQKIIHLSDKKLELKKSLRGRLDEIKEQRVSWSKARRVLDWAPRVKLDQGLRLTIDWYKRYHTMKKS